MRNLTKLGGGASRRPKHRTEPAFALQPPWVGRDECPIPGGRALDGAGVEFEADLIQSAIFDDPVQSAVAKTSLRQFIQVMKSRASENQKLKLFSLTYRVEATDAIMAYKVSPCLPTAL